MLFRGVPGYGAVPFLIARACSGRAAPQAELERAADIEAELLQGQQQQQAQQQQRQQPAGGNEPAARGAAAGRGRLAELREKRRVAKAKEAELAAMLSRAAGAAH